jgi:phosphate transport system substrate-binding protein
MRAISLVTLFIALILAPPCNAAGTPQTLRLHGSNTMGSKLVPALVRDWLVQSNWQDIRQKSVAVDEVLVQATRPDGSSIEIDIASHGTSTGFSDLLAGRCDVAMASRAVSSDEKLAEGAAGIGSQDREHIVALDGVVVAVHANVAVKALTVSQLQQVFSGEIANWSAFGGPNLPIKLFGRDQRSGTFETFRMLVLGAQKLAPATAVFEANADVVTAVARTPGAIGFMSLAAAQKSKLLAIDVGASAPIQASVASVATEDYPLARRLYLYDARQKNPLAENFLLYVLSRRGQAMVAQHGFVDLAVRPVVSAPQTEAPAEYQDMVRGAKRLNVNFRFNDSNAILDNRAMADVARLSQFVNDPANKGGTLRLAGFTDASFKNAYTELTLSESWADLVASELARSRVSVQMVRGFGRALPVAGNDEALGRLQNRRVETWWIPPAAPAQTGSGAPAPSAMAN